MFRFAVFLAMLAHASLAAAGTKAYLPSISRTDVRVVDLDTGAIVTDIPIGSTASLIAIDPHRARAYVVPSFTGSVQVIDTNANAVIGNFGVAAGYLSAIAVHPVDGRVFAVHAGVSGMPVVVRAFDSTGTEIEAAVEIAGAASDLEVSPDGRFLVAVYPESGSSSTIAVIDRSLPSGDPGKIRTVTASASRLGHPTIDAAGLRAYVPEISTGALWRVGLADASLDWRGQRGIGPSARQALVHPGSGNVYVSARLGDIVSSMSDVGTSVDPIALIPTGAGHAQQPVAMDVMSASQIVVANESDGDGMNTLTIIDVGNDRAVREVVISRNPGDTFVATPVGHFVVPADNGIFKNGFE